MAAQPSKSASAKEIEEATVAKFGPIAKVLGKTTGYVAKIVILRYVAKGVSEVFAAAIIAAVSIRLLGTVTLWLFVPGAMVALLLFDAIQLLICPQYYALRDAIDFIQQERKTSSKSDVTIINR